MLSETETSFCMNILIITPLFPPQNAVGALRPYSWAKYWGRMGHKVDVYTIDSYGTTSGLTLNLQNVSIYTFSVPFITNISKKWHNNSSIKKNVEIKVNNQTKRNSVFSLLKNTYRTFIDKTGCIMGVRYPDLRDLWAKKVINVIDPYKYDFVISTGCPYSVHKVGYYVKKKKPSVFWIVDWRDLWTLNPYWKGLKLFNKHEELIEKKFHNAADLITVVSDGLKEQLSRITTTKIISVPNGFDKEDYQKFIHNKKTHLKKLTFVYTGTIYKGVQDITPFLLALKELLEEKKIQSNEVEFIAAGNTADLNQCIEKYGLQEIYTYKGMIPRPDALQLIYNCDIALMLLGKNNKGILTGKLFEYLSLADYILGVDFSNNSDAGKIIKEVNAGECFDSNVNEIKTIILQKLEHKNKNVYLKKNYKVLEQFSREKLANDIIAYVK